MDVPFVFNDFPLLMDISQEVREVSYAFCNLDY